MNDHNNYRRCGIGICLIICIVLVLSLSGCIGVESRTNLSIGAPQTVEVVGKRIETLSIELSPDDADAKNVVINFTAPPGISLTDPHTSFQQYSKEFKKIPKGEKEKVSFNYSATFASDEYNLILEVKADNANTTERLIKVNLSVPAPEWAIGEYWVLNQTIGDLSGTHVQQVLKKESQNGKEVYVIKDTIAREINGNYRLYYYSVEDLAHIKTEYYEEDKIVGKMTEFIDPPSLLYSYPFKAGKKWNWSGTISGIGPTEFKGEVIGKEKISVHERNYDTYKIKLKYVYPLGTGIWEVWYSPDVRGVVMEKGTINMGGLVKESNTELVQHGLPPDQPPNIQPVLKTPQGWKSYINTDFSFSFNHPANWKVNTSSSSSISIEEPKTGVGVSVFVEPVGKMTQEEYIDKVRNRLGNLGNIVNENYTVVNGRIGYKFSTFYIYLWGEIKTVIFVANENGYTILVPPVSVEPPSAFDDIVNSFVIKEPSVYTLLERK
jgi:hypothetical protein